MSHLVIIVVLAAVAVAVRLSRRRRGSRDAGPLPAGETTPGRRRSRSFGDRFGDVGLVAEREIRERVRGRIFRVGTVLILLVVGAAIVIPTLHTSSAPTPQRVGVVGPVAPPLQRVIEASAREAKTAVTITVERSASEARGRVRGGRLDAAVVDGGGRILVDQPVGGGSGTTTSTLVQTLAANLGVARAYEVAGLTGSQVEVISGAHPVTVDNLQAAGPKTPARTTSAIGIVLLFLMLTQYNTWILMGVMQEKASRVVEVLLATLRPIQLLGGKVLGIGLVAMGQAALIAGFALAVGGVVDSDVLKGSATLVLLAELLWLVLGYAFYCWVYAAAGSMAERQDQVQTLVLPLSVPIILGYVLALTTAGSGHPSLFFEVLAYVPPTAPFAMPVLVGLDQVQWWQFVLSVVLCLTGTAVMAWAASGVYRRAVLRSGQRVRVRELLSGRGHRTPSATVR